MASYRLTEAADHDLENLARHSAERWGFAQAARYLQSLQGAFATLAGLPDLGRDASDFRPGYLRFEHQRHTVFYRKTKDGGVLVVRVLHGRTRPERHL